MSFLIKFPAAANNAINNESLLQILQEFIEEVMKTEGEFTKNQVLESFDNEDQT